MNSSTRKTAIARNKIYQIIEPADDNLASKIYDLFIMVVIIASIVPLAFKQTNTVFDTIEYVTVSIFVIDYIMRLFTADLKLNKSVLSFFIYPITPMAIIDLLSILPSISIFSYASISIIPAGVQGRKS